jgi:thioredoxin reductase
MSARVTVIGGGPIGVAAALGARERGFDVTLLEAGTIGASLLGWGSTLFFTPLSMNVTSRLRQLVAMPDGDAMLTGPEFVRRVLEPLAATLGDRVKTQHRVRAIGRRGLTRTDYAGHPLRAERPFRIVAATPSGDQIFESEIVIDASGGLATPLPFGAGGLPARGEAEADAIRTLGELDARRDALRGRRLLLVGHGHSAANALGVLAGIDGIQVTWAVRSANRRPCEEIANDPLPERRRVAAAANDLAAAPPPWLTVERRAQVEAVSRDEVLLTGGRRVRADTILAFTGYRPASDYLSELAIEISPVSEGNARLWRAISDITDCLSVPRVSRTDLETGEPHFYFAGSRAYGRGRTFLLQTGLAQLETILEGLPND